PFRQHHEIEDAAVLARGEVEPRHLLVVDEERGRLLLVEWGKSLPLAPRLPELHAPAHDLRNRKPRAQLVEELGRKAHGGRTQVIRGTRQYRPRAAARRTRRDCPGYPQFRVLLALRTIHRHSGAPRSG